MIILGLTGSIGMGKTTVAAMFADAGVPVFDADAEVHRLQGPGGELVPAIEAAFPGTTGPEGVNRPALREKVIGKPEAFARLEAIVHPAVGKSRAAFLESNRDAPLVALDVPLLFETQGWKSVDKIAVVSTHAHVQRARVLGRGIHNEAMFESILARQTPDAEKRARADFVIDTGGPLEETRAQVLTVIACLAPRAGG
jgi:dephospho-CoA kinase